MTTTTSTSRRSSSNHLERSFGRVTVRCSTRADGDFHPTAQPADVLTARRRSFVDLPWVMIDQRHGNDVVRVDDGTDPADADGRVGDVAVTDLDGVVLAVWAADCAPIVLIGTRSFAVVHAGWRGLAAGVLDTAVAALDEPVEAAVLGPTVGPCCYEFGADDLAAVAAGVHDDVDVLRGVSAAGRPALDVPAAVRTGLARHSAVLTVLGGCTGCSFDGFSHRARRDRQRHVVAAWRSAARV